MSDLLQRIRSHVQEVDSLAAKLDAPVHRASIFGIGGKETNCPIHGRPSSIQGHNLCGECLSRYREARGSLLSVATCDFSSLMKEAIAYIEDLEQKVAECWPSDEILELRGRCGMTPMRPMNELTGEEGEILVLREAWYPRGCPFWEKMDAKQLPSKNYESFGWLPIPEDRIS